MILQLEIQDLLEKPSIPNSKLTTNMQSSRACLSEILMVDEKARTDLNLKLIVKLKLNENKIEQTILDTASEINFTSMKLVKKLKMENEIEETKNKILPFGGNA